MSENKPKPCHKDRACTFKDLKPCEGCEAGGDKELVEALNSVKSLVNIIHKNHAIPRRQRVSVYRTTPLCETALHVIDDVLAKHKAKNN